MEETKKKDETLTSTQTMLSKIEATIAAWNHALDSSCKMVKKLEVSLSEARECWKKTNDDLWETCLENFELSKKYANSMKDSFSILQVSFENALQQMQFFNPTIHIS